MEFEYSPKVKELQKRVQDFMDGYIYPNEQTYVDQLNSQGDRWQIPPIMEELKAKARTAGLWNLFLPESEHGAGLTNLEYAPLCEIMGRSFIAPETFNCSAPDTGNMEVLARYGSEEHKKQRRRISQQLKLFEDFPKGARLRPGRRYLEAATHDLKPD